MTTLQPTSDAATGELDPVALRATLERVMAGSAYLRGKLEAAGVRPELITSPDDLASLPFTTKQELRETPLLEYAAVPAERIVRIHASSGTTGRRTICGYTAQDLEDWTAMFARCFRYAGLTAAVLAAAYRSSGLRRSTGLAIIAAVSPAGCW